MIFSCLDPGSSNPDYDAARRCVAPSLAWIWVLVGDLYILEGEERFHICTLGVPVRVPVRQPARAGSRAGLGAGRGAHTFFRRPDAVSRTHPHSHLHSRCWFAAAPLFAFLLLLLPRLLPGFPCPRGKLLLTRTAPWVWDAAAVGMLSGRWCGRHASHLKCILVMCDRLVLLVGLLVGPNGHPAFRGCPAYLCFEEISFVCLFVFRRNLVCVPYSLFEETVLFVDPTAPPLRGRPGGCEAQTAGALPAMGGWSSRRT